MILREWHASATPEGAQQYVEYVRTRLLPELQALDGFERLDLVGRHKPEGAELVVLTWWRSMDTIAGFAPGDINRAVVHPDAQAMLLRFDQYVTHHDVLVHAPVSNR